jgi:hypothetical protein
MVTDFYSNSEPDRLILQMQMQQTIQMGQGAAILKHKLKDVSHALLYLAGHDTMRAVLDNPDPKNIALLTENFIAFSRSKTTYFTSRWIDETGMERVRSDSLTDHPVVIDKEHLQDKKNRYYFPNTLAQPPGAIFISSMNLDIERGKPDSPFRPMPRIGTSAVDSRGNRRGVVLINYNGSDIP